jgi:hypothetical protein
MHSSGQPPASLYDIPRDECFRGLHQGWPEEQGFAEHKDRSLPAKNAQSLHIFLPVERLRRKYLRSGRPEGEGVQFFSSDLWVLQDVKKQKYNKNPSLYIRYQK